MKTTDAVYHPEELRPHRINQLRYHHWIWQAGSQMASGFVLLSFLLLLICKPFTPPLFTPAEYSLKDLFKAFTALMAVGVSVTFDCVIKKTYYSVSHGDDPGRVITFISTEEQNISSISMQDCCHTWMQIIGLESVLLLHWVKFINNLIVTESFTQFNSVGPLNFMPNRVSCDAHVFHG